ncbi:MAG: FMN-binding protein [Rhodoglobus sp.]|nr:FMN-binding protein [Rhodoglobus sp.]
MRSFTPQKPAIAVFAGLALVGALAGCSTPASDSAAATTGAPSTSPSDPRAASTYKDGTYTESADYQAPSGTETVDVTLTLASGVVTAVTVQGHANDPQAKLHQGQFASGIAAVVVGKNINDLQVDKVGGSSLTSGGFNAAVEEIKADAAA